MPCPMAIWSPAVLCFVAFSMVTANRGPGSRMPDSDMSATVVRNRGKFVMSSIGVPFVLGNVLGGWCFVGWLVVCLCGCLFFKFLWAVFGFCGV